MITRRPLPDGQIEVTFQIPKDTAEHAVVVGEFNDWSPDATAMVRTRTGLEATLVLQTGRSYRFRYLLDGANWVNDWEADRYADNEYGGSDSVLVLTSADG